MDEKPVFDVKKAVQDAVAKFREDFKDKSFSERHPELGRMINCRVCLQRHRSSTICTQEFAASPQFETGEGEPILLIARQDTMKGVYGAKNVKGKRLKPHHSHKLLRLVQETKKLFPLYYPARYDDAKKAMQAARGQALKMLIRQDDSFRKIRRDIKAESRRINRG